MELNQFTLTDNLKEVLKSKGISIDEFAKRADVTVNTVRNWRKSDNLTPNKQKRIASILNLNISDIFSL